MLASVSRPPGEGSSPSDRVRWAIDRAGISVDILARRMGIAPQSLNKLLRQGGGFTDLGDGTTRMARIARELGVRIQWLTVGELPVSETTDAGGREGGDEAEDAEILAFLRDARVSAKALLARLAALESQVVHLEEQLARERSDDDAPAGPRSHPQPGRADETGDPPAKAPRSGAREPRSSGR